MVNTIEDRLRAAARSVAQAVPEGSAPVLRLPPRRSVASQVLRRIRTLLTPLGAATAVLGAVAVPLALPGLLQAASGATAIGPEDTPPYYAAIAAPRQPGEAVQAVIGSTASGKVLTRVAAPRPYTGFSEVAGSASDREFLLASLVAATPERLFLLRFHPAKDTASLSELPIVASSGTSFEAIALSPDGGQVAVAETAGARWTIAVYSVTTGSSRSWALPDEFSSWGLTLLTWSTDGKQVEYGQQQGRSVALGIVNPAQAAGGLAAETVLPLKLPNELTSLALSADGDLIAATRHPTKSLDWGVTVYDAGTWQSRPPIAVFGSDSALPVILWSNASGNTMIVQPDPDHLGAISNGLYSALPSAILGNGVVQNSAAWS
jgi:hypothetical protein